MIRGRGRQVPLQSAILRKDSLHTEMYLHVQLLARSTESGSGRILWFYALSLGKIPPTLYPNSPLLPPHLGIDPVALTTDCPFDLGRLQDSHHRTPFLRPSASCPGVFVHQVLKEPARPLASHSPAGVAPHGLRKWSQLTRSALASGLVTWRTFWRLLLGTLANT